MIAGSGVWWSDGAAALQAFVEAAGIPFYTKPISRGLIPEDHALSFLNARSTAFTEADVLLAVGTRFDWMIQFGRPPRFGADVKVIHVDVNPAELGHNRDVDVPIAGDARAVLEQLIAEARGKLDPKRYGNWTGRLRVIDAEKGAESDKAMSSDKLPIHPLRLCKEVRDFMQRDAILVVDGQEILNFGRQAIPTYTPGHRLNSGAFGTMGVGLPYGVGAKVAKPDAHVLVLHGDGSFGINAMDIDTAVRHKINDRVRHQQQRRLDGGRAVVAAAAQAGPQPRLHALRPAGHGPRRPRRARREAERHPPGAGARLRRRQAGRRQRHHRPHGPRPDRTLLRIFDMTTATDASARDRQKM